MFFCCKNGIYNYIEHATKSDNFMKKCKKTSNSIKNLILLLFQITIIFIFIGWTFSSCKTSSPKNDKNGKKSSNESYDGSSKGDYFYENYMKSKNKRNNNKKNNDQNNNAENNSNNTTNTSSKEKSEKSTQKNKNSSEEEKRENKNGMNTNNDTADSKNSNNINKKNKLDKNNNKNIPENSITKSNNNQKNQKGSSNSNINNKTEKLNGSSKNGTTITNNNGNAHLTNLEKQKQEEEKRKKEKEAALQKEREEKRKKLLNLETYQFTIKKGNRLKSFGAINGPGKDYHLIQSPAPNSKKYYYLTDRITASAKNPKNVKEKSLDELEGLIGLEAFNKVNSTAADKSNKGTGFLEIIVLDSVFDKEGNKEIFYNPRFINLKDMHKGNKLGFALYYNHAKKRTEIIYSAEGNLHLAYSPDGEFFSYSHELSALNSEFIERDPAISRDGKILAFSSSRKFNSNLMGTQLYVSIRDSVYEDFSAPITVKNATNSLNELFPSIYQAKEGTFIIFRKYDKCPYGYNENLYSIRISGKKLEPMVPFSSESDYAYKYITVSYSPKRGIRVMGSYPQNGYDIFRMFVTKKKILMKYALEDDCNPDRIE